MKRVSHRKMLPQRKIFNMDYRPHQMDYAALRTIIDLLMLKRIHHRPFQFVDIGSYVGISAMAMLKRGLQAINYRTLGGRVFCVDTWSGNNPCGREYYERYGADKIYRTFCNNTANYLFKEIFPLIGDAIWHGERFPTLHRDRFRVDLVFIDCDNSYEFQKQVIALWGARVHTHGVICGTGYGYEQGVTKAVDEFGKDSVLGHSLWWKKF